MIEKIINYLPTDRDFVFLMLGGILGIVVHAYITGTLFAG